MTGLHLVTTAEQQSWPSEVRVLFLGQWCQLYKERARWQQLNHEVVDYCWDDREQLHQDYHYLHRVNDKVLPALADALNRIHGTNYSSRYWRILCGSWLSDFSEIVFERWKMLTIAYEHFDIDNTTVLQMDTDDLVPLDMESFALLFVSDRWNHWLYGKIIAQCLPQAKVTDKPGVWSERMQPRQSTVLSRKDKLKKLINRISGFVGRNSKSFFITSRFGFKEQAKLELKLGQIPGLWYSPPSHHCEVDHELRGKLRLNFACDNDFESVLMALIPEQLPRFYLEGFRQHQQLMENNHWPKNPKVLFTSNSYSQDDCFKLYAAEHVERGSKLLFGQHGGNYGISRWHSSESHNLKAADFFINWGWSDDTTNKCKALPAKALSQVPGLKPNPTGKLLLATMTIPRYSYWLYSIPCGPQMLTYINDLITFFKGLDKPVFDQSLIRTYPADWGWGDHQRYTEALPGIAYDDRKKGLLETLADCRLFIGSYDATTHLETLAANYPSVLYWEPGHWELRPEAQDDYDLLKSAGILYDTPEAAATHVNQVWDDVLLWWHSDKVQQAREKFCQKYAWQADDSIEQWASFFRQQMK